MDIKSAKDNLEKEVIGGYASDLLSDVMTNAKEGNIWVTLQIHQNIVAVASLNNLYGIILVNGREPDEDTIEKAEAENVPIAVTKMAAFEIIGRLYQMGIN